MRIIKEIDTKREKNILEYKIILLFVMLVICLFFVLSTKTLFVGSYKEDEAILKRYDPSRILCTGIIRIAIFRSSQQSF